MEREKSSYAVSRTCSDSYLTRPGQDQQSVKDLQDELFPPTSPRKAQSANTCFYMEHVFSGRRFQEDETPADRVSSWFLKYKENKEKELDGDNPQQARWPSECQVLDERVKHIPYKIGPPEPYYRSTGREIQPRPVGDEAGIILYQYYPISSVDYFSRSSVNGSKYLLQTCPSPEEVGLRFESRFESGNLAKAIKIHDTYYELYLRQDMYTNRHMQWFYFRVTGMKKAQAYRFSIVNFTKPESLYEDGMKPLMYSTKDAQLHSVGWRRIGNNITYFCNESNNEDHPELPTFYTLSFTFDFPHNDDEVFFAHNYPYTYTDLQEYLFSIVAHPLKSTYTTLRLLCKSLAGNNVYYVTITTPPHESNSKKKKAVVITARVHPGETPASWIMHGILEYLTSDCGPAKELRDNFIFKVVPMMNPDGVIVGNHRCSLTGKDLNRQYRTVIREYYPTIWYTKLMIRKLVEECGVAMYCDLHAHSKRSNIFMFGCENRKNPDGRLYEQVFPLMLHKNAPEKFSFQSCKFRVQKCKEGTGRVVMWMMGIANSFTLEASFAGSTLGGRLETHFNTLDFEQMGKTFCQTLIDFYDEDPRKEKLRSKIMNRLLFEGSSADEPANIDISDYSSDDGDNSSTSADEKTYVHIAPTIAPPPTPERKKLPRTLKAKSQTQLQVKAPARKPLRVQKAKLELMNWKYDDYSDDSSSSSSEPPKHLKKFLKKKKMKKKRSAPEKHSQEITTHDIKLNDIILPDKVPVPALRNRHGNMQIQQRIFGDNPQRTKLLEIQSKLITLKNKLWFGIGDMDPQNPLSWGLKNDYKPKGPIVLKTPKAEKKKLTNKKPLKPKEGKKDAPKSITKTSNSFKCRPAIELSNYKPRKASKQSPKFGVYNVNFDPKLPLEISKTSKTKKKKKKCKTKMCDLLPND